jgi:transcriptional regulator with XRE-family HTH domain
MGQQPVSSGSSPLGELIARERQRRSLTRRELAELVRKADRSLGTNEKTIERWERGQEPQPAAVRALAAVLERPVEELTALAKLQGDQARDDHSVEAYSLATGALDWRSLLADLRQSADLLCCLYAVRPPAELVPRVQQRTKLINELLRDGARHHQRDLVETAGWLHLLLAALHGGLGQMQPAWASRDVASRLGLELRHGELIGWSYETASWLSFIDFHWGDMLEAAEEGMRRSPPRYSAMVQNTLKVAHARAALGDLAPAERALTSAGELVARMDQMDRPEFHFMFDAPKFDKFAAEVYAEAGMLPKAVEHARISIARSDDPTDPARFHPMRASTARVALASALLDMGGAGRGVQRCFSGPAGALPNRGSGQQGRRTPGATPGPAPVRASRG